MGNFSVINSAGESIVYNDGDFGSQAIELICPGGAGCVINAEIVVTHSINDDGVISILTTSSTPYSYSINGGQSFTESNTFPDLLPGEYQVVVQDESGMCAYEETVTIEECTLNSVDVEATNATSVTVANGSIIITPTSGLSPYLYSIDGGQNFVYENEFYELAVGNYNIVIQDASGVCEYEINIPIEADSGSGIVENGFEASEIIIYPNPTRDQFYIEFNSYSELSEEINIVVFDNWGRIISTGSMSNANNSKTMISLIGLKSGIYYVKCYNNTVDNYYKVVKI
jgi:hypothetical protein